MNYFAILIIFGFLFAGIVEACQQRWIQCQIYFASAWLNIVFLSIKS